MMGSGETSKTEQMEKTVMRMRFSLHYKTYFIALKYILHQYFTIFPSKKFSIPAPNMFKKSYFFNVHL